MPLTRVRSTRRDTVRGIWFAAAVVALMAALLGVGTWALQHYLREDARADLAAQVRDPSTPLGADERSDLDYVALGDSYSAGPGLPPQVDRTCARSSANYPSLLADRLRVRTFTDVTCSGARTLDITQEQVRSGGTTVAPQVEALGDETDLVTLSIGGNDESVFNSIVTTCPRVARLDPTGSPCQEQLGGDADDVLVQQTERLRSRVSTILRTIRKRAPHAQVVVVGYPAIFPTSGTCDELPFAAGDVTWAARVVDAVVTGLQQAAADVGVRFVDLRPASAGHDVCAREPWMTGVTPSPEGVWAWHPVDRGMEGAADAIYRQLTGG